MENDIEQARASNMEEDEALFPLNFEEFASDFQMALFLCSRPGGSERCIYRVPQPLRNVNGKAYSPLLISIGPLHRENTSLKIKKKEKLKYIKKLTERVGMDKKKIIDISISIENQEERLRHCYSEKFELIDSRDFVEMILLDAVFIIQFLLESKDFEPRMTFDIRQDLMLLENQLPFFIIQEIYDHMFPPSQDATAIPFLDLASSPFGKHEFSEWQETIQESKHFTDLLRSFMLRVSIDQQEFYADSFNHTKLKYSAVMLRKAGVKFQATQDKCLLNIRFEKGVLKIPQLEVDNSYERLVRNIMALEQCCYPSEAYVCSYIKFMDNLINSAEDVGLLVRKGIILNRLGDDAAVSNLINHFCENINDSSTCFGDISQVINAHYESRFNHMKATLKLIYFPNIWRGTATVAAAILLILTLIQTIASVKSAF